MSPVLGTGAEFPKHGRTLACVIGGGHDLDTRALRGRTGTNGSTRIGPWLTLAHQSRLHQPVPQQLRLMHRQRQAGREPTARPTVTSRATLAVDGNAWASSWSLMMRSASSGGDGAATVDHEVEGSSRLWVLVVALGRT